MDHKLSFHLYRNCWPEQGFMYDAAAQAIDALQEGDAERLIDLPQPVWPMGATAQAHEIVRKLNLGDFVSGLVS